MYTPDGSSLREFTATEATNAAGLEVIASTDAGGVVQLEDPDVERLEGLGYRVKVLTDPDRLRVGAYDFDVTENAPPLPRALRLSKEQRAEWPHHIVQLVGPPLPEFIEQLEQLGLRVVRQIDRYAVAVVGDAAAVDEAAALPAVVWTGRFEPAFRVAADVANRRGTVPIAVGVFPPERRR